MGGGQCESLERYRHEGWLVVHDAFTTKDVEAGRAALLKPPLGREKPWHQDKAFFNLPVTAPVVGGLNCTG